MKRTSTLIVPLLASIAVAWTMTAQAASHREAPLIALDPPADNTDVYAFVSYDSDNIARAPADRKVTFILNVNPGQDPGDGPNYFNFDDQVLYTVNIDNNQDGNAGDIVYEFRFTTENRPVGGPGGLTSPVPYLGNPHITALGGLLQGITALDGPGSEGLTRRQTYTVTEVRGGVRTPLFSGRTLIAVPSNSGPATMPNYPALAAQGVYNDAATGIRVFAGQRAETFYIDLGAVFDTLNLRRYPPLLTGAGEDADNTNPYGVNRFSGANISTIALEVPITRVTSDGKPAATTANPVIGMYASTARQQTRSLGGPGMGTVSSGPWVQVSRMANPLVNELIINTPNKDAWNAAAPANEAQFQGSYTNPVIATELNLVYGFPIVPIDGSPASNRTDLMSIMLKYPGQALNGSNCGSPCSELLRLDLRVPPTAPENQSRLGAALSADLAGWPNGRRPNDDVTDIVIRVAGGTNYVANKAGDGVNFAVGVPGVIGVDITSNGIAKNFPFLPTPYDGKNRRHIDCNEKPFSNPCGALVP
ncbi:MAG TPA: DUF4331 domain-containing protein [Casimicrobiaceae bacterium]|nr:DUF4331 domain-containing protein [Casimicrobiaceae bacterium]